RVRLGLDLGAEIRPLGRLVGALTGAVVFPPVIETAKLFAFHASKPQWHRTMRTTRTDNVDLAARAPIDGEVLAKDSQRPCLIDLQLMRMQYRLPERAQIGSRQRARPGLFDRRETDIVGRSGLLRAWLTSRTN